MSFQTFNNHTLPIGQRYGLAHQRVPNLVPITRDVKHSTNKHSIKTQLSLEELKAKIDDANQPIVVECFAWWCPHCKNFAPSVLKAHLLAKRDPETYYPIVSIDIAKNIMERKSEIPKTCTKLSEYLKSIVPGYPTIARISLDGDNYNSDLFSPSETRDVEHLLKFAKKN